MTLALPERTAPAAVPMPHRAGPLSLGHMAPADAWKFAEALANTPLLPDAYRKQPASVLWAMEYGRALGLDVVTTITTIHVIKGKPTQSADLMLSRAREAGHRVRVKPERHRCVVSIQRHDDPDDETVIEWTLDDAVTACLCEIRNDRPYARDQHNKPTSWEKYPRAMLRSRAIAEAVRTACPEVLHGAIYTPEELGAVVDQEGNAIVVERADEPPVMQTATVVQSTPNQPTEQAPAEQPHRDYLAEAHAAENADAVRGLWQEAQAAGAPAEYLDQLAAIGRAKAEAVAAEAALTVAAADDGSGRALPDDVTDAAGEPQRQDAAEHATALADMYAAAHAAGMESRDEADKAFGSHYECRPAAATAAQLREQAATLRQIAGAL